MAVRGVSAREDRPATERTVISMTGLVELAGRLDREANRVRGRAAHFEEQGQSKLAARELQLAGCTICARIP